MLHLQISSDMIGPLSCRHDVRQAGADAFELVLTTMQRETFLLPRQAHPKEAYPTARGGKAESSNATTEIQ